MSVERTDILIRLGLAVLAGFLVGLERERHQRPAGIKTHILVCVGATIVSIIQLEMVADLIAKVTANPQLNDLIKVDMGRLPAQVISGIGFLGAGTILRTRGSVRGLTTAATLWMVACVGLGIGMGYYFVSISATILIMILLFSLKFFQEFVSDRKHIKEMDVIFINKKETMEIIEEYFEKNYVRVKSIEFPEDQDDALHYERPALRCIYKVTLPRALDFRDVLTSLSMEDNILKVNEHE